MCGGVRVRWEGGCAGGRDVGGTGTEEIPRLYCPSRHTLIEQM